MAWRDWERTHKIAVAAIVVSALITSGGVAGTFIGALHPFGLGATKAPTASQITNNYVGSAAAASMAPGRLDVPAGTAATCAPVLADAPSISDSHSTVLLDAKVDGAQGCWQNRLAAPFAPANVRFLLSYKNTGHSVQQNLVVRVNVPPDMHLVPNTTEIYNSSHPDGVLAATENLSGGGLIVGNYAGGAVAYVTFDLSVPSVAALHCGATNFKVVGVAHPQAESEYYNIANVDVTKAC